MDEGPWSERACVGGWQPEPTEPEACQRAAMLKDLVSLVAGSHQFTAQPNPNAACCISHVSAAVVRREVICKIFWNT
jgi:hypothetical protein